MALNSEVMTVVRHSGLAERLGRERMFFTLEQAVEHYLKEYAGAPRAQTAPPAN